MFVASADGYGSYGRLQSDLSSSTIPRVDAIVRFDGRWEKFQHLGNVPEEGERQEVLNALVNGGCTTTVDESNLKVEGDDLESVISDDCPSPVRRPSVCVSESQHVMSPTLRKNTMENDKV